MKGFRLLVLALVGAVVLAGCHFKSVESFNSATTTVPANPHPKGDPGSASGTMLPTGGVKPAAK